MARIDQEIPRLSELWAGNRWRPKYELFVVCLCRGMRVRDSWRATGQWRGPARGRRVWSGTTGVHLRVALRVHYSSRNRRALFPSAKQTSLEAPESITLLFKEPAGKIFVRVFLPPILLSCSAFGHLLYSFSPSGPRINLPSASCCSTEQNSWFILSGWRQQSLLNTNYFKGYFPLTAITKYRNYKIFPRHPWAHLTSNSLHVPLPHSVTPPSPPHHNPSLFSASVGLLPFLLLSY